MAHFMIGENGKPISNFFVPSGRKTKLVQWGGDAAGNTLRVMSFERGSGDGVDFEVLPGKLSAASTAFQITGKRKGASATISAVTRDQGASYAKDLTVTVTGAPHRQPTYTEDLLYELAANGNAFFIDRYNEIVTQTLTNGSTNTSHFLSQNRSQGSYNCGDVAYAYSNSKTYLGAKHFAFPGKIVLGWFSYAKKLGKPSLTNIVVDQDMTRKGISQIKSIVGKGNPVRIKVAHANVGAGGSNNSGAVTGEAWGVHFVTIIGYSANRFMFVDPWGGGTGMTYDGGVWQKSFNSYLGELKFDLSNLSAGINNFGLSSGPHQYVVIEGP